MPSASPELTGDAGELNGRAVRAFIVRFAVFSLLLAFVPLIPGWDGLVSGYMSALAGIVTSLLHLLGQPAQLDGADVFGGTFRMTLAAHCSALDIVLFYSATVLAFPAPALRKFIGLAGGLAAIVALNVVRIASVYVTGLRWPAHVQGVHEELWPVLLIMGTVALCAAWVCYARKGRAT